VILADTSVWIGHLRGDESRLAPLLEGGRVLMHPAVLGEVALGSLQARAAVLGAMAHLPRAVTATDAEALALVESHALHGQGIGWVDVHLLAATLLTPGARLWSADRRLAALAARAGVAPSNTG
jgi:predicted nucleic acid-binding protein